MKFSRRRRHHGRRRLTFSGTSFLPWIDASHQILTNADDTWGQFLKRDPLIQDCDPNGLFTSEELTRVRDAVDAVVEP